MNKIKELLKNPTKSIIINVTRDYFFSLTKKESNSNSYFIPIEAKSNLILNESHIKDIFNKLGEIIDKLPDKLIVIVFEEYFFSEGSPMKPEEFKNISNICQNFTSIYANTLLFVNLLHIIDTNDIKIIENNIKTYSNTIVSKIQGKIFWNVSSLDNLLPDFPKNYFRNCTYIYMFGKILYQHKKSSYFSEITTRMKYDIGFFEMNEINPNLNEEEKEITQLIIDTFQLHICLDFTNDFETKINNLIKEKDNDFYFTEENKNEVNKLIDLYQSLNLTPEKKQRKKIFIIQSNYFDLNSTERFDDGCLVIKSDPMQQMVFKVKKSKEISELINNINNFSKIYKESNKNWYMLEGIEQSEKERISIIYNLNFFKEVELFCCRVERIPLSFDDFKLNAIFNIYEVNID